MTRRPIIRGRRRRVRVTWYGPGRVAFTFKRLCELAEVRMILRSPFAGCRATKTH
jgi:hypothetical protein